MILWCFLVADCGPDEYRCDMGMCIPGYLRCNQYYDCPDHSDEGEECGEWTKQNGRHFANDIFKWVVVTENCCILIKI